MDRYWGFVRANAGYRYTAYNLDLQGEEGDGLPQQSNELVEFGWNMIKVNTQPSVSATKRPNHHF